MSTAKSVCYMAPPALISKCQPPKNGEKRPSVPPSSPLCRPQYLTDSAHISYSYCKFSGISLHFEILWIHTDPCEDCFHYHSTGHNIQRIALIFCTAIILSRSMNSFDYGVSISIFENPLECRNFMNTHLLMFRSGFVTPSQLTIFRVCCSYLSELLVLVRVRIILIAASFVEIGRREIILFPWSWGDHITLNLHLRHQYLSWNPTKTVCLSILVAVLVV